MAQNIHYHYKRQENGHSEEILIQSKAKTQQGKLASSGSLPDVKGLWWLHPFSVADCSTPLFSGLVPLIVSALLSRYPTALASLTSWGSLWQSRLHLCTMASLGLHARTPLTHAWLQWLSLVIEGDFITPFFYLDSKARRATRLKLPSYAAC